MENYTKYICELKKHAETAVFHRTAVSMLAGEPEICRESTDKHILYRSTALVIGPAMISYILWILKKAVDAKTSTLFFLARDGKIMKEIAERFIAYYKLDIDCRYLYVSRYSLRKAIFLIAPEEAIEYMCRDALVITPSLIMKRSCLNEETQKRILKEMGFSTPESQERVLNSGELHQIAEKLRHSRLFLTEMEQMTRDYNHLIFQYFQEQGLTARSRITLVDSGWTGSMQRSIRQILAFHGYQGSIEGYYFGIQRNTDARDGIYHHFYFGVKDPYRYVHFNNNLFECWCMAGHGMTIGYKKTDQDTVIPVLNETYIQWKEGLQYDLLIQYSQYFLCNHPDLNAIDVDKLARRISPLLIRFMMNPDKEEAHVYGNIPFCDDTTEAYFYPLASTLPYRELFRNLTIPKIINKISHSKKRPKIRESNWKEGTIALLPQPISLLLRIDCRLSYLIKILAALFTKET